MYNQNVFVINPMRKSLKSDFPAVIIVFTTELHKTHKIKIDNKYCMN